MNSPHTLGRGKAAFSSTATERPARARCSAAVAPAGPPPITATSNDSIAARDKEMGERPREALRQDPAARDDGPHSRELLPAEAGAYADHRVVARDVVAADQPHQPARDRKSVV